MIHDPFKLRLGRGQKRIDARTIKAARVLKPALTPKPSVDWLKPVPSFPMYGNDVWGDCVTAGAAHLIQVWSANVGKPVTPDPDEIIDLYHKLSPNDQGLVMLDFLNYWRQNLIAGVKIGAFVSVNIADQNEMKIALDVFGGLYAGMELPVTAQDQEVWDIASGPNAAPDSWGSHCFPLMEYMNGTVGGVTWGAIKLATWKWVAKYTEECYAIISPDWLDGSGKSPEGLDVTTLTTDMAAVMA